MNEAKDGPSTNEELDETGPQEVPDQNVNESEETKVSETNATDETELPKTEESQSEEPPASVQEQSPVQTETTEAKDADASDAAATTGDEFVKDDDDKTEATEESKADESQNVTSEKTDEDDKQSEKETVNSDDVVVESSEMKEEDAITSDIHKVKKKKEISIKWQEEVEITDEDVLSEEAKSKEESEGDQETKNIQMENVDIESRFPEQILPGIKEADESDTSKEEPREVLRPDSPSEQQEEEMEGKLESEDALSTDTTHDRAKLIEQYQQCISIRDQLQQQNAQIQQKLAEFFKKKKPDDNRADKEAKNLSDLEQRYLKLMAEIEDLQEKQEMETNAQIQRTEELEEQCAEKKEHVNADQRKLQEMKRQVAQHAINSRTGKPMPEKDIDQYLANEAKKDAELENVRLENIKLKNKLKKKELQLKSKEELAEGLHLIDFEQLKIENQTYNEKIEERNEELQKLRKKIKSTVEVQTHMKEKLQFIEVENEVLYKELQEIEAQVAQKRDELSRTKQMRDALKRSNTDLRKNCGLLGNQLLLRNFEDQKDENAKLLQKLENLKMRFAEYTMQAKHVQHKIDQVTQQRLAYQK
ncbi:Coiled-coil domain-containing protein 96 [Acanthosepion pharaonis]|uniref:Coiled-coil domain-containing protein 96 n=1 Tax=Acanthosepion pharaonis TaxID=158019 RepID=A0A812E4V5_ACAPH|nr:Coiled-coil domain-containing protein 96 [Sepia pharaonis]